MKIQSLGGILASVVIHVKVELCTVNKLHLMSQVIIMDSFCFAFASVEICARLSKLTTDS